jgi:hypothetical protein
MFEYCSTQADRAYKLLEDGDQENGMFSLAHLADILQFLTESKHTTGGININQFLSNVRELAELEKDQVYIHLEENGFGQFIPE